MFDDSLEIGLLWRSLEQGVWTDTTLAFLGMKYRLTPNMLNRLKSRIAERIATAGGVWKGAGIIVRSDGRTLSVWLAPAAPTVNQEPSPWVRP